MCKQLFFSLVLNGKECFLFYLNDKVSGIFLFILSELFYIYIFFLFVFLLFLIIFNSNFSALQQADGMRHCMPDVYGIA